ncbi:RNA 3'-terminal phosphate cyclase [Sphingosinicella sp. BN140058]|uniref:RNA 3'-terminal phosphate cyclase n=1 Tax=Sphingosinicella sp. BN140058 TaxID=1892855 RepID=UPI0010106647|nr:RNA 3'-terminal phosphate cyclase [Sphingosinicella sp. BN140058]QAY78373.1 RNA 3'-terminal phosphate cyclase [Sphingosinicella sp. BN140058]
MIEIDGAQGEGGGQVLRIALSLALVTGQTFRIENIRANRSRPGLMRQHATAVEAACAIGGSECEELAVGASALTFVPGAVRGGDYHISVGTAGSTGLVLQTILPPLMLAAGPSRLVLEGGTHNIYAPPFDFLERVFLPIVNRMGPTVSARLIRHGFYPAGGGRIEVDIQPTASLTPLNLIDRGDLVSVEARALVAALPGDIAVRELAAVGAVLGWPEEARRITQLPERSGPGNIVMLEAVFDEVTELVSGFGKLGVAAHIVGDTAAKRMAGYLASGAVAGPFLADQLLLPLALAGSGQFTTVKPSLHSRTAAEVIARFLDVRITFQEQENGNHLVTVARA